MRPRAGRGWIFRPLLPLWGPGSWSLEEESGWEAGVKSEREGHMDQIGSWLRCRMEGRAGRREGEGRGSLGVPVPSQAQ